MLNISKSKNLIICLLGHADLEGKAYRMVCRLVHPTFWQTASQDRAVKKVCACKMLGHWFPPG